MGQFLNPNLLKTTVALTALVFMMFVLCHHNAIKNVKRKVINSWNSRLFYPMIALILFSKKMFEKQKQKQTKNNPF